ncbi:zinc ABC transporter ATP-binding protein [Candidatus Roizmanbacteria bacterium RIFCSPLOWO2_01_FULL_41_22]|uniref:Zinc ABC transporter ATP-binding protein n=2 Tax=Candidatus Roizmaniibacteriota TaxID=1752723 RepID=A0A1F7JQX4_9BACT|nr:MAG: zinc ABC transporter ATP-binding protein [Candidatus Roizmanbacteria bacterium RIFCSPLOWO2_01_FULL_41_22]OGK57998.1 MAG: zinc ABC transporter ATP-binding protein [Candidatus Roizmanbacteria bacterium RIFCSPLOWO2_02_FULL_41_9]
MPVDHTKTIIELKNISFAYQKEHVLRDINLQVHLGDYLGMIGPNGGGKTTLLKIMLGLLKPSQGSVCLFSQPLDQFRDWPKIGYVPQKAVNFDANFPATVYEVVAMGRYGKRGLFRRLNASDKKMILESLRQVEMIEYKDRIIGDLSGGQQQRVFIARALSSQPQVILLDEPTVGVDLKAQEAFYQLLQKLNQKLNLTLVLVSHDIDVVAHEATELACVNTTLIYDKNPQDFLKDDRLKLLYGHGVKYILHNH